MTRTSGNAFRPKVLAVAISCALWGNLTYAQTEEGYEEDEYGGGQIIEAVVVWGVRASQARAIDVKRNSDNIVDAIVAEDIGRMPDTTITDSLQRVPGIQINREANEGTSLNIRGMPQVLTTLNGEQFLSPWSITSVGANYSDIPAGMIGGADVYKSMSAISLAGGISGLIDLKTIDPYSLETGWTGKFSAEYSEGSLNTDAVKSDTPDHDLTFYVGHKSDRFAVMLGGFSSSTNAPNYQIIQEQRLGFLDTKGGTPGDPQDLDGDGDVVNDWYLVPSEYSARANFMERKRLGASLGIGFQMTTSLSARADIFYTAMEQFDRGVKASFNGINSVDSYEVNGVPASEEQELYNVLERGTRIGIGTDINYTDMDGNNQTRSLHTLHLARVVSTEFQTQSTNDINRTGALNANLQLDYSNHDNFEFSVRYVHGSAEKEYREANLVQGAPGWLWIDQDGIPGKDAVTPYYVTVDYTKDIPEFSFDADLSDANLLQKYMGQAEGDDTEATLDVFRTDFTFKFDNVISSVDFGLRHGIRSADKNKFYYVTPTARYSTWGDPRVPEALRYQLREGNELWERTPIWRDFVYQNEAQQMRDAGLEDNGFDRSDTIAWNEFGPIKGFEGGVSAIDPNVWNNPLEFMNQLYPGTKTISAPGASYKVEEAASSFYTQINFEGDIGWPFTGNIGAQVISTTRTVETATVPALLDRSNSIGYDVEDKVAFVTGIEEVEYSYTDVLPSFNINFQPTDSLMWRIAASKNVARNDLENIGSGLELQYQKCAKTDENGDPVLVTGANGVQTIENVDCVSTGSDLGDPEILPWQASVYNTSLEWYFAENALLSGGVFLINVDASVERYQEQRRFVDADGIDRGHVANIWTTANAGASDLYGFEFGYRQPFSFLPGTWLSSTGVEFNYTYSDSESADTDLNGDPLPLPSNSAHQTNFIFWLEKDEFSFRMAYNWRSEEYIDRVELNSSETPLSLGNWQAPTAYLDMSIGYWFNDHVSVYLNGTNLTEQDRKTYSQYQDQFHSLWVQERRIALGLTLSI